MDGLDLLGAEIAGGGGHHGGGGGHHHGGSDRHHHGGLQIYGGPWGYGDGFDVLEAEIDDGGGTLSDVVNAVIRRKTRGNVVVGVQYDLGKARDEMNTLRQVPVGVARTFVQHGLDAIGKAFVNANQPWYHFHFDLPGDTARKEVQGHVQWHQANLAKFTDPQAIYPNGDDLKEWTLRCFIEENATEEGAETSVAGKAWSDYVDMWKEVGSFLASLPPKVLSEIRQTATGMISKFVESTTGLPLWAWGLVALGLFAVTGLVAWAILNSKAGAAATGAVVHRYIGG